MAGVAALGRVLGGRRAKLLAQGVLVGWSAVATPCLAFEEESSVASLGSPGAAALSWDALARELMSHGRLDDAQEILDTRLAVEPADVEARFLKGMIEVAKGNNRKAIRLFRSILINQPKAARVRLELARAFYLDNDFGNATRQFQFALAGNPPPTVVANIDHYLRAIRDLKSLSYTVGLSIAPDSNLNTGSSAREVSLFGLPFDLSEDARQRSGVGLAVEAAGEWAPRLGAGKRLRLGIVGQRREYSGKDFDDMTLAVHAGPRLVSGKWDLSLLATGYRRWFASHLYNQAKGARVEATYHPSPRLAVSGALGAQWVDYRRAREMTGPLVSVNSSLVYALTPSSAATIKGGVSRQTARISPYSNWNGYVAAGYFRDLPLGFSIYAEPSISMARYDESLLGFGEKRADSTKSLLVTLLNRHLVLTRFTPRISYTFTKQNSTITLYDFTRSRVEMGLTTVF